MAKAKTLTPEAVGLLRAERLAALLLEAAEYDPALMRSVRFAVAGRINAAAAAAEIDQQIRRFRRSRAFVDQRQRMAFARDLGALVDAIAGPLADLDPAGALARMLDFIALTPSVFERSHDDGTVGDQFQAACAAVATLIERTPPGPAIEDLVRRTYALYLADDDGVADESRRRPRQGPRPAAACDAEIVDRDRSRAPAPQRGKTKCRRAAASTPGG